MQTSLFIALMCLISLSANAVETSKVTCEFSKRRGKGKAVHCEARVDYCNPNPSPSNYCPSGFTVECDDYEVFEGGFEVHTSARENGPPVKDVFGQGLIIARDGSYAVHPAIYVHEILVPGRGESSAMLRLKPGKELNGYCEVE